MPDWTKIQQAIFAHSGQTVDISARQATFGGDINQALILGDAPSQVFLTLNQPTRASMFAAEFEGLHTLTASQAITVPEPICHGIAGDSSFIAMQYLPLAGAQPHSAAAFGKALAAMHHHQQSQFGWQRDNTIGSTPQSNRQCDDWPRFWQQQRLGAQLRLAQENGASTKLLDLGHRLNSEIPAFFSTYSPHPSCLHGDLWSGNWGFLASGEAVIFDPAVYFGDRETDLAMTELFGSAGPDFYAAYHQHYPIDAGYSVRRTLYNLYHILNHYNLFGGGYAAQAEQMTLQLLSEIHA